MRERGRSSESRPIATGRLRLVAAIGLMCAVCAVIVAVIASSGASASDAGNRIGAAGKPETNRAIRAHRQAAIRDAEHLLAGVSVPPGAVLRSSSTGIGRRAHLIEEALDSGLPERTWAVPGNFSSVLSFVTSHLRRGSQPDGTESGGIPSTLGVIRAWPSIKGRLGDRLLQIQATAQGDNLTLLSVVAQSQWIVARSRSERIPVGVREIDVTSGVPGKQPFLSRAVTSAEDLHTVIKLFDSSSPYNPESRAAPRREQISRSSRSPSHEVPPIDQWRMHA